MVETIHALTESIITFEELREPPGDQIPHIDSPIPINNPKERHSLLRERINGTNPTPTRFRENPPWLLQLAELGKGFVGSLLVGAYFVFVHLL